MEWKSDFESQLVAPGYRVEEGNIKNLGNGERIEDIEIEKLNLSVRSYNGLRKNGVKCISDLVELSAIELFQFRNLGRKSVVEIVEKVRSYLESGGFREMETKEKIIPEFVVKTGVILDQPLSIGEDVLGYGFVAYDGVLIHRESLMQIPDKPIEELLLSVRAFNCLQRAGYTSVGSLIGTPYSQIREIRNMGAKSAFEIQEKLESYLETERRNALNCVQHPESEIRWQCTPEKICNAYRKNDPFTALTLEELNGQLGENIDDASMMSSIEELLEDGKLKCIDGRYCMVYPGVMEYLENGFERDLEKLSLRFSANTKEILAGRLKGSTLEMIGEGLGITRERVRQLENKGLRLLNGTKQIFEEDRYKYLYETYNLERGFYLDLSESKVLGPYLSLRYIQGHRSPLEALDDVKLSVSLRRRIESWIYHDSIKINGQYIPKQRAAIEDYVLRQYCREEVNLQQFFSIYEDFLEEHGIEDESVQLTEEVKRTRYNRLSESACLLWKQNQRLRYYDVAGGDYSELFEELNLGQYANTEISTLKFMRDYPELMERYDIHDEYELHNLLKKIHAEHENPFLTFGRMPMLRFGEFNRDAAVKEMLFALAPINQYDFAEQVESVYGVRKETVLGTWLPCIAEYAHQGIYSVEWEEMPENEMNLLKTHLTEDFYLLSEVKQIYAKLVERPNMALISSFNLCRMGFVVKSSYVIQNYSSAEAYFNALLLEKDVADLMGISRRFTGIQMYAQCLARARHERKIIEFEPYQYINLRRLERMGIGLEQLQNYCDQVWCCLDGDGDYFSIHSLRQDGFASALDDLGFGELFYGSLLREDDRFSWQKIGKTLIFRIGETPFQTRDFLAHLVEEAGTVEIDEFVQILKERFGVDTDKYNVLEKLKDSDIYYDRIMEKLYADYEIYFEEI